MIKKIIIFACLLFIISCTSGPDSGVGPEGTPFLGGVTALSMKYLEDAPPPWIFDDGQWPFSILVEIENLGEYDVEASDGYIEITGIEAEMFGLSGQDDLYMDFPHDINGVKKNFEGTVLLGDTSVIEFGGLRFEEDIRGNWDGPRIRANLCYNYETEATTAVCLKRDMLTKVSNKEICELTGEKPVFNSGAPIQISLVKQSPMGSDKIHVQFEISHVGTPNDRFYKMDTECDDRSTNIDKDQVYFELVTDINGNLADCSGLKDQSAAGNSGYVVLHNGAPRIISCQFDVGDIEGEYEKQLKVKLRYRYSQFIEKRMLIKDVSTGADDE